MGRAGNGLTGLGTVLSVLLVLPGLFGNTMQAQDRIIISQYIETSSGTTPKGIELWNVSGSPIDFSVDTLIVRKGTNGGELREDVVVVSGALGPGAVLVIGTADLGEYLAGEFPEVLYIEKHFTYNGNDALQILLGGHLEDTFGRPGADAVWEGEGVSTRNQNIALLPGIISGAPDGFSDPSLRFEVVSTDNSLTGFGSAPGAGTVPDPERKEEPDDTVHSLSAGLHDGRLVLGWIDAGGRVPPDGYVIFTATSGRATLPVPVDGEPVAEDTDASDGLTAAAVEQGVQTYVWSGVPAPGETYRFRVYSYTNSGTDIDYLTGAVAGVDLTVPPVPSGGDTNSIPAGWINEFHYDNAGPDTGEFVEIVLDTLRIPPDEIELVLYNGSDGGRYKSEPAGSFVPGETAGVYRCYVAMVPAMQNGPDGMALVRHGAERDTVLDFISYEGVIRAIDGPAAGISSVATPAEEGDRHRKGIRLAGPGPVRPVPVSAGRVRRSLHPAGSIICRASAGPATRPWPG